MKLEETWKTLRYCVVHVTGISLLNYYAGLLASSLFFFLMSDGKVRIRHGRGLRAAMRHDAFDISDWSGRRS